MWLASRGERLAADLQHRDFRRAAADIEEHRRFRIATDQRRASGDGKPRLGLAVDDLQVEAGLG